MRVFLRKVDGVLLGWWFEYWVVWIVVVWLRVVLGILRGLRICFSMGDVPMAILLSGATNFQVKT